MKDTAKAVRVICVRVRGSIWDLLSGVLRFGAEKNRVRRSGFRVQGWGFGFWGFRVLVSWFRVQGSGC